MNRELDAKIAEEIFGWHLVHVSADANGENECDILYSEPEMPAEMYYMLPVVGKLHKGVLTPHYSSDLRTAIRLCNEVGLQIKVAMLPSNPEDIAKMCYDYWKTKQPATI